jgi:hypothetical protein
MGALTKKLRKAIAPVERVLLGQDYFTLQDYLTFADRWKLMQGYWRQKWLLLQNLDKPEISFILYSKACERLLIPLLVRLLQHPKVQSGEIQVNCIVLENIHQLRLAPQSRQQLSALHCQVQTTYLSLIRACHRSQHKLAMVCLDHQARYEFHKCGVDTVKHLKSAGVKTICIQHGGTRSDSVAELSSSVSDLILVWGRRVEREMQLLHNLPPERVKVVGNPLHDRLKSLNQEQALKTFQKLYPEQQQQLETKKVVLLATCLHSEYKGREQEQRLYETYMRHIYQSLDFSKVLLLIKMHPLDQTSPNIYQTTCQSPHALQSTVIIGADVTELDIYQLIMMSDLVLTRASTVGEEALMLGKKVIAFDLFADGPSIGYKHLADYGSHRTVYAEPSECLEEAMAQALSFPLLDEQDQANIIADLTYALDGQSTQRAVEVLLAQTLNT